jgi:hypothetical protein
MAKIWDGPPLLKSPAAQALLAEVAVTARRKLALLPGPGLGTSFQAGSGLPRLAWGDSRQP